MLVKYIIPEDGDDFAHPNVFNLQSDTATLNDVRKGFPVPGTYHFRYLKVIGNMTVWMDAIDGQADIPLSNGSIFLKISRPTSGFPPVNIPAAQERPIVDTSPQPAAAKPPKPVKVASTTDNLIFDFNETPATQTKPNTFEPLLPAEDDLLGMSSNVPKQSNASNNDLFGLESIQPSKPSVPSAMNNSRGVSPMGGMSMSGPSPMMQQQQPMSQPINSSTRHGSIGGMGGMGMGGVRPSGGGFDPFDNLTGLNQPRPMGGQQQGQYGQNQYNSMNRNQNNAMNQQQQNRGRGF